MTYRVSRWFHLRGFPRIARFLKGINYLLFNCVIPPECLIGEGTRLFHSGLGIIIHPNTVIGENCNIYNFVVFGGGFDGPQGPRVSIKIGDNCNISTGSKILCRAGELRLGNNCTVAANSVVLDSFPSNVVIGGIPARKLKSK